MKKIFYLFALLVSVQKIYSQDNGDIRIIVGDNHKFAYAINKNGKWENLTEFIYDDARHFENTNVAWVRYNGKCAIINKQFKLVSALYDDMSIWVEGKLIAVQKDGIYGFIDVHGKEIIPLQYSKAAYVIQDKQFVSVSKNQKWALLDLNNKQVIDFKYNSPIKVEDGYVLTSNDSSRFGLMKLNEQIIIPFVYDQLRITSTKDRFIAQNNKSLYLLNERNKQLFSCTDCDLYAPGYLPAFVLEENKKRV